MSETPHASLYFAVSQSSMSSEEQRETCVPHTILYMCTEMIQMLSSQ